MDLGGTIHVVEGITTVAGVPGKVVIHRCGDAPQVTPLPVFVAEVSIYDPMTGEVTRLPRFRRILTDATYFQICEQR